jgi:transcriptional regulator with AAA-type ATPase domain
MLQANEIQQRMSHIQQTIGQAEQACMSSADASPELKECIQKISDEVKKADAVIKSNDEQRIIACVDSLEDMGDDAKRLSRSDAHISPQLETAVTRVHAELSELKHKLH